VKKAARRFSSVAREPCAPEPAVQFKLIRRASHTYSVRVGFHWRALGRAEDTTIIWFWIGSHADYDKLISQT